MKTMKTTTTKTSSERGTTNFQTKSVLKRSMSIVAILLFVLSVQSFAQQRLWGMSQNGSSYDVGVIFSTDATGGNVVIEHNFEYPNDIDGRNPQGSLMRAGNGMLYGMTLLGGTAGLGVLFEFNPTTHLYTKKVDFIGSNGRNPTGSLMKATNGKLYGMTQSGGLYGYGVIFQVDLSGGNFTYSVVVNFDGTNTGYGQNGNLIQATNGKLYGVNRNGGLYSHGVLFEYTIGASNCIPRYNFSGWGSEGSLVQCTTNGLLYGMTYQGGTYNLGSLFQYNTSTFQYSTMVSFSGTDGRYPSGSLIEAGGNLYGMSRQGGYGYGNLFKYTPGAAAVVNQINFTGGANIFPQYPGETPCGSLLKASDGNLYGMTTSRSNSGRGNIFRYNYTTLTYTETSVFAYITASASPAYPYYTNLIETGPCAAPATPGIIAGTFAGVCANSSATFSIPLTVSNATSYTWTAPAGATFAANGLTTYTSPDASTLSAVVNFGAGFTSGTIKVQANNGCGSSAFRTSVTINSIPTIPVAILGTQYTGLCPLGIASSTYSVAAVAGATSYTWTAPTGATFANTSNTYTTTALSVVVDFGSTFVGGKLTVTANNACGSSAVRISLALSSKPPTPGVISGTFTGICPAGTPSATYSIPAIVAGATNYTWTAPAGATFALTTTNTYTTANASILSALVNFSGAFTSGTLTVTANNACGSSTNRISALITSVPPMPGVITGTAAGLCNVTNVSYSVTNVLGMTYAWTAPFGVSFTGQGTNAILATFGNFGSGTFSVSTTNACGSSLPRTMNVKGAPATPTSLTGSTVMCNGAATFTVNAIPSATYYMWTIPNGTAFGSGQGTTDISLNVSSVTSGNVSVLAYNACGIGLAKTVAVGACHAYLNGIGTDEEQATEVPASFLIYPNPTSGLFNISIANEDNLTYFVAVYNVLGEMVSNTQITHSISEIDLSANKSGFYFIMITDSDNTLKYSGKIIKE
jgi:uncharacterized repeat protein (TIGR03803 family)